MIGNLRGRIPETSTAVGIIAAVIEQKTQRRFISSRAIAHQISIVAAKIQNPGDTNVPCKPKPDDVSAVRIIAFVVDDEAHCVVSLKTNTPPEKLLFLALGTVVRELRCSQALVIAAKVPGDSHRKPISASVRKVIAFVNVVSTTAQQHADEIGRAH